MNKWLNHVLAVGVMLFPLGCGTGGGSEPVDDPELSDLDVLMAGAPDNADLSDEKTDDLIPKQHNELIALQSPIKSQGSRGVCSVFATTGYMEHLYKKEGTYPAPDFSEQYLQWSVKFEVGSFPRTSGSNASYNLQAISRYGIVEEEQWPYEPSEWGSGNDSACDGSDDQPTRCYTNGEPPQAAKDAKKWKLPSARWVSTRPDSIKAFIVNKGVGVQVGMRFFYQSWNHRRSSLPTSRDYWSEGYVLYPNDKDKEVSKQAGHSILIVGWDDELEVQKIDAEGNGVVDAAGEPVMERGFFLFKNSWGTGSFGASHPHGDGYGWLSMRYVDQYGSGMGGSPPDVIPPAEVCGDGLDNDRDDMTDCDDPDCSAEPQCQTGPTSYENSTPVDIPDKDDQGAVSEIEVTDAGEILALSVTVDISHTYSGDIEIRLIGPDGTDVQLQEPTMESFPDIQETYVVEDFNGKDSEGIWTLKIVDHASMDTGNLNTWKLEITR